MLNGTDYGHGTPKPWWEASGDEVHREVVRSFEFLDERQTARTEQNQLFLSMYSNRLASGLSGSEYLVYRNGQRLRLNVVKAVADTALAHIASNRPRIVYLTSGGNYSQRAKAKKLTKFIGGMFHQCRQYTHVSQRVFTDSVIFGTGFNKISERGGRIKSERIFANEIQVDDREAFYGDPLQKWHHKEVERSHWIKLYPEKEKDLKHASLVNSRSSSQRSLADPISLVESWILPSEPGADDGRHVVASTTCTLIDEKWESDRFPVVPWRWCDPPVGYWGIGLAEELQSIQAEINMLLIRAQESLQYSGLQLWMPKSERNSTITNRPGGINYYSKAPPTNVDVGGLPPIIVQQIENLYGKAFEISGVSQMAAMSRKPPGLNSGAAIREYNDVQSQRFLHVGQRWEQYHIDVAEEMIQRGREIKERGDGDIKVLAAGNRDVEEIAFGDVALPRDQYVCRAHAASLLPTTPSGQIDQIIELSQASPDMGRYLLHLIDHPDLEAFSSMVNADVELVDFQIEQMLDKGEPQTPQTYLDRGMAKQRATYALLRAERDDVEELNLELLRTYISILDKFEEKATEAAAPPAPPMAEMPPMPPEQVLPPGPEMMMPAQVPGAPVQ